MKKYLQTITYGTTAIICFLSSLFPHPEAVIDIINHDTYFVIGSDTVFSFIGIIFSFYAIITWTQEHFLKKPKTVLFILHFWLTILGLLAVWYNSNLPSRPSQFQDYSVIEAFDDQSFQQDHTDLSFIILIIVLLIQLLFVINIVLSLSKRK